jgi:hypothetical protein
MEYGIRLDAAPTLPAIAWTFLNQVQCDTCKVDGLAANGTGQVSGLFASNSWFATNENVGFHIGYYATVAGVQLSGCQMVNNGASGVNLQFHSRQVAITGCIVSGNGRDLPSAGIAIAPGVEDVTLTGNIVGPFGQFSNLQTYGVFFNEPITRCTLVGNSLSNNISGAWNFLPPLRESYTRLTPEMVREQLRYIGKSGTRRRDCPLIALEPALEEAPWSFFRLAEVKTIGSVALIVAGKGTDGLGARACTRVRDSRVLVCMY